MHIRQDRQAVLLTMQCAVAKVIEALIFYGQSFEECLCIDHTPNLTDDCLKIAKHLLLDSPVAEMDALTANVDERDFEMVAQHIRESVSDVFATNWNKDLKPHLAEDVYGRGFAKAVLLRIEMEQQDDSVEKIFNGSITIEHVLPQTMTDKYWTARFTADEHQNWVHKLGNLTLLSGSKNSNAQNSDFDKKKVVFNERNKKVSFDLTKEVCQKSNWSPLIIKNRHEELVDEAIKIWKI